MTQFHGQSKTYMHVIHILYILASLFLKIYYLQVPDIHRRLEEQQE